MVDRPELAQVDTSVKIPAAVKAASAKADELHKVAYKPPEPAPKAPDKPADKIVTQPVAPAPVTPAPVTPPVEPQLPKPDAPVPTLEKPVTPAPAPVTDQWEHRYNSMKGRYEVAENNARELRAKVSGLEQTLATLQSNGSAPKLEDVTITPQEETDYGPEFLALVGKKAQQIVAPYIRELNEKIAKLDGKVTTVDTKVVENTRDEMLLTMDQKIPNWREINKNQKFFDWLALQDPYSGAIRHELLQKAFERNNAPQVMAFFYGFLKDEAVVAPSEGAQPVAVAPATPAPTTPAVSLESLAAPGRAKNAAETPPAEKPIITNAQITSFYAQVNSGKFKGREVDKNAFEAEIFAAAREGRIR